MSEKWIEIRSGIEVSSLGQVRNKKTKHLYDPSPNEKGHLRISPTWLNKTFSVHRLVAEAFCNKGIGNNRIRHIDGDLLNNSAQNLEWYSRKSEKRKENLKVTKDVVREFLTYIPESGEFFWKERNRRWFKSQNDWAAWNAKNAGQKTGIPLRNKESGYLRIRICIFHQWILAHRVAWMFMSDDPVPKVIDHINRDATDNRWANLRASSNKENSRNRSLSPKNTSGFTGVSSIQGGKKWLASGSLNGKHKYLGTFEKKEDAAKAAFEFRKSQGYDKNHGLKPPRYRM